MNIPFINKSRSSIVFATLLLTLVPALGAGAPAGAQDKPRWESVLKAYDDYINYPSPDRAKKLLDALPNQPVKNNEELYDHVFGDAETGWMVVAREANAGDRNAIEILLRFLWFADGIGAEVTLSTLVELVRIQTRPFLEVLYDYRDSVRGKSLISQIGFASIIGEATSGAERYDLEMRIKALEAVEDPKLIEIKEESIRTLRQTLARLR